MLRMGLVRLLEVSVETASFVSDRTGMYAMSTARRGTKLARNTAPSCFTLTAALASACDVGANSSCTPATGAGKRWPMLRNSFASAPAQKSSGTVAGTAARRSRRIDRRLVPPGVTPVHVLLSVDGRLVAGLDVHDGKGNPPDGNLGGQGPGDLVLAIGVRVRQSTEDDRRARHHPIVREQDVVHTHKGEPNGLVLARLPRDDQVVVTPGLVDQFIDGLRLKRPHHPSRSPQSIQSSCGRNFAARL